MQHQWIHHWRRIHLAVAGLFVVFAGSSFAEADLVTAGKQKAQACATCHGADGNSADAATPKLAGQMPEYLVKQMRDFRDGRRTECDGITPSGNALEDTDIQKLSAYYAEQSMARSAVGEARLALGEKIFTKGKRVPNFVPACKGCHGLEGKGKRDWNIVLTSPPALLPSMIGGQHPTYLAAEIRAFRDGTRSNDTAAVMRKLAQHLTEDEIDAVAAYAGTLLR